MATKTCKRCTESRPLSEFNRDKRSEDGKLSVCGPCYRQERREYRSRNRNRINARQKQERRDRPEATREHRRRSNELQRQAARALLAELKDKPCVDCGVQLPPACMDLDHVRGEKSFPMALGAIKGRSREAVLTEAAKCEVRCPNCHRLRHHRERGE